MALFRRKKNTDEANLPAEVQEYYSTERRQSRGVAFLLAVATVIVTILLALGLYFGGRWVYDTFFGRTSTPPTQQEDDSNQDLPGSDVDEDETDDTEDDEEADEDEDEEDGSGTGETPRTGPGDLPSTGPSGNSGGLE